MINKGIIEVSIGWVKSRQAYNVVVYCIGVFTF
jgi:hypothetical protein